MFDMAITGSAERLPQRHQGTRAGKDFAKNEVEFINFLTLFKRALESTKMKIDSLSCLVNSMGLSR